MKYITNILISLVAILVLIFGGFAFGAVFGWMQWSEVWDYFGKIALGGLILGLVAAIVSMVVGSGEKSKK